mmetsp:Transcript_35312/g.64919  ORF Transcript_35312/g.64919 Transcript_35312/m.64919 type:complete len:485 (-) Transcript_35312:198-1652(-)
MSSSAAALPLQKSMLNSRPTAFSSLLFCCAWAAIAECASAVDDGSGRYLGKKKVNVFDVNVSVGGEGGNGEVEDRVKVIVWTTIGSFVGLVVCAVGLCHLCRPRPAALLWNKSKDFDTIKEQVKAHVESKSVQKSEVDGHCASPLPFSGTCKYKIASSKDEEAEIIRVRVANLHIVFTDDGKGYALSGRGQDTRIRGRANYANGTTRIRLSCNKAKYECLACWEEYCDSGPNHGMRILVCGTFNFKNRKFSGWWRDSERNKGWALVKAGRSAEQSFDSVVHRIRADVDLESIKSLVSSGFDLESAPRPYSGVYSSRYEAGYFRVRVVTLRIAFTDNQTGYTLRGRGQDSKGRSKIIEGHANYSGLAWWVEQYDSGGDSVAGGSVGRILSCGNFDFHTQSFSGWLLASGISAQGMYVSQGTYVSFGAVQAEDDGTMKSFHTDPCAPGRLPAKEYAHPEAARFPPERKRQAERRPNQDAMRGGKTF